MDHFGWTPLFAAILGVGDTAELKPSPLLLQEAMRRTGHAPDTTWMVCPDFAAFAARFLPDA